MSVLSNVPILSLNKSLKTVAIVFVFLQQKDSPRSLTMSGHVGFESLPDQLVNRSIQQGFCFNILCVGECPACPDFLILFLCSPPSCDGQYGAHLSNLRAQVQIFLSYLSSISFFLAVLL